MSVSNNNVEVINDSLEKIGQKISSNLVTQKENKLKGSM